METTELLRRMAVFAKVVELGSFTKAGESLALGKSAVSKQVTQLEEALGVRLLNRSTRSLGLTDTGQRFYERCVRMMEEAQDARRVAEAQVEAPRGTLRITGAVDLSQRLVLPVIRQMLADFPELEVQLQLQDELGDLTAQGVDVSLRVGFFRDSSLVARRLHTARYHLYASPEYLASHPRIRTPRQTATHTWAVLERMPRAREWTFHQRGRRSVPVTAPARLRLRNTTSVTACAEQGLALVPLLDVSAADALRAGRLVRVLPRWTLGSEIGIYATFPHRGFQPPRVTVFVERVHAHLRQLVGEGPPPRKR